jgi:signal transduction histidine kinase/ActR/RegA family two-component response regulator
MRIAAKLKLFASVPVLMALIICLAILFSHKTMARSLKEGRITRQIMHSMNELNDLVRSYMIYQNDRPKLQFFMEDKNLSSLMASITFDGHEKQQLIDSIHRNFGSMRKAFLKLVSHHESTITVENEEMAKQAAERLKGRISIKSRDMLSDALQLESLIHNEISNIQQRINLLILIIIIAITVPLTFALIRMIRRINKPLLELRRGTEFIAAGNLSHRTAITAQDEIGELSVAFDLMTEKLIATTVSRDELLKEIEERKRAEEALRQLNETLEQQVTERTDIAETRARQLQALAVELLEAEELERQRIAELLHDDLQQMLAAALFQLQAANVNLQNEPTLESVKEILVESIEKSRKLSHELSPPVLYHGSLYSALEWLGCQMNEQFGLKVELQNEKSPYLENTPLKVFLFRAVQELLFNIVKHAGVKSARVSLSGSNGNVTVTVSDQGNGFDKDIIDSSREKEGFGLISIRERAQRIGGYLKIKSQPGQGSSLILVTPAQTAATQEPVKAGDSTDADGQKTVSIDTKMRVLFVDDHKVMRQGLIGLISGQPDIEVAGEAANGREAVELARQLRPDVIVMDISMPEMDGIEATRLIKSEFPDLRIVGLSMFEDDQSVKSIIHAGADAFVPKTASSAELLKAIYGNRE